MASQPGFPFLSADKSPRLCFGVPMFVTWATRSCWGGQTLNQFRNEQLLMTAGAELHEVLDTPCTFRKYHRSSALFVDAIKLSFRDTVAPEEKSTEVILDY